MSEPLVDPLKIHTFGVKRPLEEKKHEIEELERQKKRYYPKDKKGELDEWGAVIKNQNEMFTRMNEMQRMDRRKQMENYSHELATESDKRTREQKFNQQQEKSYERMQALNKQREAELLNQQTMASKRSMQSMLAQDYETAMRMKNLQKQDERRLNLMAGQASNQKAQLELDYLKKAENDKKRMIQEILTSEKNAYDDRKRKHLSQSHVMERSEAQKLMAENEQKEAYKDYMNSQKYSNFNRFQSQVSQNYQEQVAKPHYQKQAQLDSIIKKQEADYKRKQDLDAQNREKTHMNWRLNNRATIEKQIQDKRSGKRVGETEFEVDLRNRLNHERNINEVQFFEKFKKRQDQDSYKEMLDNQIKVAKQRKMYGNMTGVEKSLNKDDLVAWKHYDHNTYALIPGLNSSKRSIPNKILADKMSHKRERSHDEELQRMNQFGFTRDVTMAKDPSYQSAVLAQSTRKLPDNRSLDPNRSAITSAGSQGLRHNPSNRTLDQQKQQVFSSEVPNRSLLKSGHRKYPNHHLYSNYNPISGAFGQAEGSPANTVFKKAGNSILY